MSEPTKQDREKAIELWTSKEIVRWFYDYGRFSAGGRAAIEAIAAALASERERWQAENARLQELLRGTGANRYWEGRWRDADAENGKLREAAEELAGAAADVRPTAPSDASITRLHAAIDAVDAALTHPAPATEE